LPSLCPPNIALHLPLEAGARHERRLEAVRCKRLFGGVDVLGSAKAYPPLLLVESAYLPFGDKNPLGFWIRPVAGGVAGN
jgi:hypothetical protein